MTPIARALLGAVMLMAGQAAFAQGAGWTISEVAGTVTLKTRETTVQVRRGSAVPAGAVLATGPGSRVVAVRGRDFITVNANSRVQVPGAGDQSAGFFDILQDLGNALFQIEKQPDPHFRVRTPYLAAVVKGTTFSITVSDEGASLQVVEGAVETSTADGGAHELIRPGVVAMVEASDRMRLRILDQQVRVIDSPAKAELRAGAAPAQDAAGQKQAEEPSVVTMDGAPDAVTDEASSSGQLRDTQASVDLSEMAGGDSQSVARAIAAVPSSIGTATDGLVTGSAVGPAMMSAVASLRGDARETEGRGNGPPQGNPGTGPGNGPGNSPGNGSGTGNGPAKDTAPVPATGSATGLGREIGNAGPGGSGAVPGTGNGLGGSGNIADNVPGPGNSNGNGDRGNNSGTGTGIGSGIGNSNGADGNGLGQDRAASPGNGNGNGGQDIGPGLGGSGQDAAVGSGPGNVPGQGNAFGTGGGPGGGLGSAMGNSNPGRAGNSVGWEVGSASGVPGQDQAKGYANQNGRF